jgi:undecaprenyl-phosphate galactose phosphotransferase/putative colanic acid biosynthesis UDP-glucose lipid carrier transferase
VFFKQQRSGRGMILSSVNSVRCRVNTDSDQVQQGDSRVTKMGAFMRKTNIDELPQFFNVFYGTILVSGPRPHMLSIRNNIQN